VLRYQIIVGSFVTTAILGAAISVGAQEPATTIYVDSALREIGEEYLGGYLQVYADGQLCGELSFNEPSQRTPDGGAEFALGAEEQPAACSRAGATLSLFDGNLVGLSNRYALAPNMRIQLSWFEYGATRSGLDEGPSADGRTYLTLDPELRAGGGSLDYLDVYADGEACGRFSFREATVSTLGGGAEFELGSAGQPEACGRDGAIITLTYPNGIRLSAVYRLTVGQRIAIQNFTIPPPHTGDAGGVAPGAPEAGVGLAASSPRSAMQTAFGVATALLFAGVVLYVVSRRNATR
jgi:hypothetical protein